MSNTPSYCWPEKIGRRLSFKLRCGSPCLTDRLLVANLREGKITSSQTRHHNDASRLKNVKPTKSERQTIAIFAGFPVVKIVIHARQITFEFADDLAIAKYAKTFEGLINCMCHSFAEDTQRTDTLVVQAVAS